MIQQFDVLAEKYNVRNIKIADEMFVLREGHFLELCRLLKERNHGFNIWAYSRIDTVKPKHLAELKAAGVNWLALGIESKSKFVRDGVAKGRFGDEDIYRIVREIKDAGIHVIGNYIFGLPDDTFESMNETLEMALEMNCEMGNFYSAMAYPGSQLYELAVKESIALPETWLGYSQHAYETLPLATKHVTAGEVLAFRDYAWNEYFTSPNYLAMIKAKFGEDTLAHITEMRAASCSESTPRRLISTILQRACPFQHDRLGVESLKSRRGLLRVKRRASHVPDGARIVVAGTIPNGNVPNRALSRYVPPIQSLPRPRPARVPLPPLPWAAALYNPPSGVRTQAPARLVPDCLSLRVMDALPNVPRYRFVLSICCDKHGINILSVPSVIKTLPLWPLDF